MNSPSDTILKDAAGCTDSVKLMRLARNWKKSRDEARKQFTHTRRLAILCSATSDTYAPLLDVTTAARGLFLETWQAPYGTWQQQIIDAASEFHKFKPEVVLLHLTHADLTQWPALNATSDDADHAAEEEAKQLLASCDGIRKKHTCPVLLTNFHLPSHDSLSNLSAQLPASRSLHVQRVNLALARLAPAHVILLDIAGMSARFGVQRWIDPVAWLHAKQPMSYDAMPIFAQATAAVLSSLWLGCAKCIVLDLDNTLWGGVVADDGVEGIKLGQGSSEGEAFLDFQRFLRELRDRGILLAVCSKNQDAIARGAFEQHDEMLLKLSDFSAFVANFTPKADNLRAIAKSLNIGLDSLVFVDDNPVERDQMRQFAPQVRVLELPDDPSQYVAALASCFHFEAQTVTDEDLGRVAAYAANQKRDALAADITDVGEFLKSLNMIATLGPYTEKDIPRATQLINKSNQFNLCTRRYTQEEIETIAGDPTGVTLCIRLRDRFGDYGLISAIHGAVRDGELEIENWVMSCRVLDRTVEQTAINHLAAEASLRGCTRVSGRYLPTAKNALVKEHYAKLGFQADGANAWKLDLKKFIPFASPIKIEGNP